MSSITILQENDKFTYFVDTAESVVIKDTIYRIRGAKKQKAHQIAKDVVFLSGNAKDLDIILSALPNMVGTNEHIDIDNLQAFLRRSFPPIDDMNSKVINGLTVMSIINGKTLVTAMKQSYEHFKKIISDPLLFGMKILTEGFDNVNVCEAIMKRYKKDIESIGISYIDNVIFDTYKELYSEGVGGEIQMYLFDASGVKLIRTEMLNETGLRCINKGINLMPTGEFVKVHINGYTPVHAGNIGIQSVAFATNASKAVNADYAASAGSVSYASEAGSASLASSIYNPSTLKSAWLSINDNFIGSLSNIMYIGSSANPWAGGFGVSGWITTSDERLKEDIKELDERYVKLAKMLVPKMFKMKHGTSGRYHIGFIAQEVEAAMSECGISDMEFAGLIKAPVYAEKLKDEDGNELPEYDTTSEIVNYTYHLRYEEFIPLLFLWLQSLDKEA